MKKLFSILFILFCCTVLSATARSYRVEEVPNVQLQNRFQFTSNPDNILSPGAVRTLDTLCYSLRHRALAQVAIVAVDDIDGGDIFDFAMRLFQGWGVGNKELDNGLGILLVVGQREVQILPGNGLEGELPDVLCGRIIDNYMTPYFVKGDYDTGMIEGMRAITAVLEGSEIDLGGNDDFQDTGTGVAIVSLIVFFVLLIALIAAFARKGGNGGDNDGKGGGGVGRLLGGMIIGSMLGRGGGGFGGGFGGGSSGGGFGGGGFGGGGARGGW